MSFLGIGVRIFWEILEKHTFLQTRERSSVYRKLARRGGGGGPQIKVW